MITDKMKCLFQFIEFLHSNIENFKQYDNEISDLRLLRNECDKVRPQTNYREKWRYDEVKTEMEVRLKVVKENIITPIRSKAIELNICNFQSEPIYSWYGVETDIDQLKENFSKEDLPEIFKHKSQYLQYRTETKGESFLSLELFFHDLDELLKRLFDYFKETEQNEFEAFETETTRVDSIHEAVEQLQKGHKSFTLPIGNLFNPSNFEPQNNIEALPPPTQQTETKKEQQTIEAKPIFKPEAVQLVFEIIKDFFGTQQQNELKQVIKTGNNASQKLLFKDSGNRLTDTFKKLIEYDFITGCQKQDLINWIVSNFTFIHQNKAKAFVRRTVEKTISGNDFPCKSPLIEIKNGQIQKVGQPRKKTYDNY